MMSGTTNEFENPGGNYPDSGKADGASAQAAEQRSDAGVGGEVYHEKGEGAAAPGDRLTAFDTHWIWQDGQQLTQHAPQIRDGYLELPEGPGLGITLNMERVEAAHALYNSLPDKNRNDALGMQFLIDNWSFNAKRPAMLR